MMIKRITFLFTGVFALFLSAQEELGKRQEWLRALGAGDFETRDATMTEIWEEGGVALEFLESLVEGDDPEIAARATTIVRKMKLGISPETPAAVVQLIDQYFTANEKLKISVLERLLQAQEHEIILRLGRLEESANVLNRIDAIIAEILPQIVRDHLNVGDVDLAIESLALSQQFSHLIQYAHLLERTGGLAAETERLSQSEEPEDRGRYLACLRVQGQPLKLREAAKLLGARDAETLAGLTMGDHVPYLESWLERSNPPLPNRHYVDWTLANHRGDQAGQKKAYDALVYLCGERSERQGAQASLFLMGYGEVVFADLGTANLSDRIEYLLRRDRYADAQKLIGIPEGDGFDVWLDEIRERAEEEISKKGPYAELERLMTAIEFLEERGLREKAIKCAFVLFDLVRPAGDLDLANLARQIFYAAPLSTYTAIARELAEHEAVLDEFLEVLSVNQDESIWLFHRLEEVYPEMEIRERLLLAMSFSAHRLFVTPELFQEARDRVFDLIETEDDRVGSFQNLFELLVYRNREEDLRMVLTGLSEAGSPNHYISAILAIDGGRLKAGSEFFAQMETDNLSLVPEVLYRKGLAFKKAGMAGGDELMAKALLFSNGSDLSLRSFAMEHLRYGEVEKAFELMKKALLRCGNPAESAQFGVRNAIIGELATEAATLGRWQDALAYREVAALDPNYVRASVGQGIMGMRLRFQILTARGAIAMERGDIAGAVTAFSRAYEILPSDGYLANDLFPLLRKLGLNELHNQFFARTARGCRESIRLFPRDDNAYNNFAWMASRANRCLDEAEEYLKIALKISPESAAYLDTMGEIYFARKDRERAIQWSKKSLQNAVLGRATRWELQYQNLRFKTADFPVR